MKFEMKIDGIEILSKQLERIAADPGDRIGRALIDAGIRIQRVAKVSIAKSPVDPKTGASFPGNAPHTQTGTLVNSIYVNTKQSAGRVTEVIVGTDLKYGQFLEFGTVRMHARPWLVPAFAATKRQNLEALQAAVTRLVKEKGAA
jgi:HK97 gp10 family phage protein